MRDRDIGQSSRGLIGVGMESMGIEIQVGWKEVCAELEVVYIVKDSM